MSTALTGQHRLISDTLISSETASSLTRLHLCPHCGTGEETAEHLLLFCPKWAAERQLYFGHSIDTREVLLESDNLVEFLSSSGHLPPV